MCPDDPSEASAGDGEILDASRGSAGPGAREHPFRRTGDIPSALLDDAALRVVRRLQRHGHEAYLVGGCVRDLIAGLEPKDFDVATDAHPGRIRRLFRNARIIGRRFRLAHIRFGRDHVVETSTFRAAPREHGEGEMLDTSEPGARDPRAARWGAENVFGTAPEDARRRDFTVNALFYDPVRDQILDWVGGLADMEAGIIRCIGDPEVRLREDPVRMIRAIHFAERMGFRVETTLEEAIRRLAPELGEASHARLYIELLKVLNRGRARPTLHRLYELGVLAHWLPELTEELAAPVTWPSESGGTHEEASRGEPEDAPTAHATWNLLAAADRWGMSAHGATDALSLATLLAPWVLDAWRRSGRRGYLAFMEMAETLLRELTLRMSVPRKTAGRLREMLWMLPELRRAPEGRRAARTIHRRAFPEALALLRLDLRSRDADDDVAGQWENRARSAGVALGRPTRVTGDRPGERGRKRGRRRGARRGRKQIREEASAWRPAPPDGAAERSAFRRKAEPPAPEAPGPSGAEGDLEHESGGFGDGLA